MALFHPGLQLLSVNLLKKRHVISLVPAATEFLFEMGLGKIVAGRSDACDFPEEAFIIPVCSKSLIQGELDSFKINEQVSERLRAKLPLFEVDAKKIIGLKPDAIVVQQQCSICAISPEHFSALPLNVPQITFSPLKFADLWTEALRLGEELGYLEEARETVKHLKTRVVDALELIGLPSKKPRVLVVEWLNPLMTAGNWVPDMISMAGGEAVLSKAGTHSGWVNEAEIIASHPEKIIVVPCGFGIEKTKTEFKSLLKRSPWNALEAIQKGECYLVDGNHYFNRPGPRLVKSFEILAEILNPKLPRVFAGESYERLH
ncbi:MAG: cobalamin-binding protein [Verrucomicrobiales bacterium]|nr:cobalamin-binding protein [Verrucomicrobiales bacterium]